MDITPRQTKFERDPYVDKRLAKEMADEAAEKLRLRGEDEEAIENEWWSWFEEELRLKGLRIRSMK